MSKIYHYFVEGECEQKLLNAYRISPYELFTSGKVTVFNFINKKLDYSRIRVLDRNTIIILVYDIDVNITKTLEYNLSLLKKFGFNKIYHIQSINNFEDELVFQPIYKTSIHYLKRKVRMILKENLFIVQIL